MRATLMILFLFITATDLHADLAPEFSEQIEQVVVESLALTDEELNQDRFRDLQQFLIQQFLGAVDILPPDLRDREQTREWFIYSVRQMLDNTPHLKRVSLEMLRHDRPVFLGRVRTSVAEIVQRELTYEDAIKSRERYREHHERMQQAVWEVLYLDDNVNYFVVLDLERHKFQVGLRAGYGEIAIDAEDGQALSRSAALLIAVDYQGAEQLVYQLSEPAASSIFFFGNTVKQQEGTRPVDIQAFKSELALSLEELSEVHLNSAWSDWVFSVLMKGYERYGIFLIST